MSMNENEIPEMANVVERNVNALLNRKKRRNPEKKFKRENS